MSTLATTNGHDDIDLAALLQSMPSTSTATVDSLTFDGPALLASLKSFGLGSDLTSSDLSISLSNTTASSNSSSASNPSLSILLSRLSLLLSDLSRQLEAQTRLALPALLAEASRIQSLQASVQDVRKGIEEIDLNVAKLRQPTSRAVVRLTRDQKRLKRLAQVGELTKKAARFVMLARRLENNLRIIYDEDDDDGKGETGEIQESRRKTRQREREEALVRAARGLEAIGMLVGTQPSSQPGHDLESVRFVKAYLPSITKARAQVLDTMEQSIVLGLRDLNPSMLSSSLLTASALGVLKDLVRDLMADLTDVVRKRVEVAFHVDGSRTIGAEETGYASYRSKRQQQQQQQNANSAMQQQQELLSKSDTLFTQEMTAVCSKIYLLQQVLGLMKRPQVKETGESVTAEEEVQQTLLDEGIKVSSRDARGRRTYQ